MMLTNTATFPAADPDITNVMAATIGTHIILLYIFIGDGVNLSNSRLRIRASRF
jgi:hypothetical protein